jgi:hypothetical protein
MSKVVLFSSYRLRPEVSIQDFLRAAESFNIEYVSKQKGYISFNLLVEGTTWADFTTFKTLGDAKNFADASDPDGLAEMFYSFIRLASRKTYFFSVEI